MGFSRDYSYMFIWNEQQYYTNHFTWRKIKSLMNRIIILSRTITRNTDKVRFTEINNEIASIGTTLSRTIANGLWTGDIKHMDVRDKSEREVA